MSEITTRNATDNFIAADSQRGATFVGNNEFEVGTLLNASGASKTFEIGTLLGRIAATNQLVPCASAAIDGSALPVGILAEEVTLADDGTASVNFAISGDVAASALILDGGDTLATVVSLKTIGDRIKGDTKGIRLVTVTEGAFFDN